MFGISPKETTFAHRGFWQGDPAVREQLEYIGKMFVRGYHEALDENGPDALAARLDTVDIEFRGFAFEGASMSLALQDYLLPWRRDRLRSFMAGPASAHIYHAHVGAGWALARLRRRVERPLSRLDPLLGWLAVDGYGFHEGYFHTERTVLEQATPGRLTGYARRVFDQGVGRSLWFVECADVDRIAATIAAFDPSRRADLWSGVSLACGYAGGVGREQVEALRDAAAAYEPQLAQGAAFAAGARQRAGNPVPHTDLACRVLTGTSAESAAALTDETAVDLPHDGPDPAYEVWRQRIQARSAREAAVP